MGKNFLALSRSKVRFKSVEQNLRTWQRFIVSLTDRCSRYCCCRTVSLITALSYMSHELWKFLERVKVEGMEIVSFYLKMSCYQVQDQMKREDQISLLDVEILQFSMSIYHSLVARALPCTLSGAPLQPGKMIVMPILSAHNWPNTQTSKQTFDRGVPTSLDLSLCSFHMSRNRLRYRVVKKINRRICCIRYMSLVHYKVWQSHALHHTPLSLSSENSVTAFPNPPRPCSATGRITIIQTLPSLHQHYTL